MAKKLTNKDKTKKNVNISAISNFSSANLCPHVTPAKENSENIKKVKVIMKFIILKKYIKNIIL